MPEISKITLPSGTTYTIKDEVARQAAALGFSTIICTSAGDTPKDVTWTSGSTSITGTLVASSSTKGIFYLVPSPASATGDIDNYDEYITVGTSTYAWEKLGNTQIKLSDLGSLAHKNSASGNFTPQGTVSKPGITVTPTSVEKYIATSTSGGGSVTAGSVTAGTSPSCTLPTLSMSVSNETLTMSWSAGSFSAGTPTAVTLPTITMPTFTKQSMMTGATAALSATPTFTGTSGSVTVS